MSRAHAIRRAIADFDALHGRGAAVRDGVLGALSVVAVMANLAALGIAFGLTS